MLTSASVRGYIYAGRIKMLYEKGPDALGVWHPPGYRAMRLRDSGLQTYNAFIEFKVSATRSFGRWQYHL